MRFSATEEHAMIRDTVAAFVRDQVREPAMAWNEHGPDDAVAAVVAELGAMGLLGVMVHERHGGAELGAVVLADVLTELAFGDAGLAAIVAGHSVALDALLQRADGLPGSNDDVAGTDAEKIEALATGKRVACVVADGLAVGAPGADVALVLAESCSIAQLADMDGEPVRLLGLRTAGAWRLASHGGAVLVAGAKSAQIRATRQLTAAAIAIGIGRRALQAGVQYSLERAQFGKPIARYQPIQWMTADSATELEAATLMTMRAAWLRDAGQRDAGQNWHDAAARAYRLAARYACKITDRMLQVHGGYGYTEDYVVERLYRDAATLHAVGGSMQVATVAVGAALSVS